jgi:hypothetical protein
MGVPTIGSQRGQTESAFGGKHIGANPDPIESMYALLEKIKARAVPRALKWLAIAIKAGFRASIP